MLQTVFVFPIEFSSQLLTSHTVDSLVMMMSYFDATVTNAHTTPNGCILLVHFVLC
jgi:hypothetical protein